MASASTSSSPPASAAPEKPGVTISLNASQLSTVVCLNPYETLVDVMVVLWKRHYPQQYQWAVDHIAQVHKVQIVLENDRERLKRLVSNNAALQKQVRSCLQAGDTACLNRNKEQIAQNASLTAHLSGEEKQDLQQALKSVSNKSFGCRKEKDAISLFQNVTGKTVNRVGTYFTQVIPHPTVVDAVWQFGGKIDGLTTDNELVEIKNRVKYLFRQLRPYENIQVQLYLHLLGLTHGFLVESFVKKTSHDINVINVTYDATYWNHVIMPRVYRFIHLFENLIQNPQTQIRFLMDEGVEEEYVQYITTGESP